MPTNDLQEHSVESSAAIEAAIAAFADALIAGLTADNEFLPEVAPPAEPSQPRLA